MKKNAHTPRQLAEKLLRQQNSLVLFSGSPAPPNGLSIRDWLDILLFGTGKDAWGSEEEKIEALIPLAEKILSSEDAAPGARSTVHARGK